jgi:DUF438 domain-containing protein
MSEIINNRKYRQEILKKLIQELHNGKTVDEVKPKFEDLIKDITPTEISEMEQALILEGMPIEEIQRLCDVHASIFKGSIEDIHKLPEKDVDAGHPINVFKQENIYIEKLINGEIKPNLDKFVKNDNNKYIAALKKDFNNLTEINKHYLRKENILFPYMEKHDITGPPKVMWGVDDEIRAQIKAVTELLNNYNGESEALLAAANETLNKITEMIFKEENILFPMVLETLTQDEWIEIQKESADIGFSFITPSKSWNPNLSSSVNIKDKPTVKSDSNYIKFDTGILKVNEISSIFNSLPVDITFIDKDDLVKYFSEGKERIFPRTKAIIGREVKNCHPPKSVDIVARLIEDFKNGNKESEDFWINMGGKFILIRYFAVRDTSGEYLGTLEFTQNISPIQEIKGEKRLSSK